MGAINSRDEPSWLVAAVSDRLISSTLLLLLHSLPQAAPPGQHLPLQLPNSLPSGSFSCRQSLVLPRLIVRYSWWRQSFEVIFKAPNFSHSVFDPLFCTETQWLVDKVMLEHYLHSVLCDIHTAKFLLGCSRAAVCPCTLFRVCCLPHSEAVPPFFENVKISMKSDEWAWGPPSRMCNIGTVFEKAEEVSWWMLCLGKSQGQKPRGRRPQGFWPRDLPRHNIQHDTSKVFS